MSSKSIPPKNSPLLRPTAFGAPFAPEAGERAAQTAVNLEHVERLFERTAAHDIVAHRPAEAQTGPAAPTPAAAHPLKQPTDGCLAPLLRRFTGRQ